MRSVPDGDHHRFKRTKQVVIHSTSRILSKSRLGFPPDFRHSFKSMDRHPFPGATQRELNERYFHRSSQSALKRWDPSLARSCRAAL